MSARINYVDRNRGSRLAAGRALEQESCPCEDNQQMQDSASSADAERGCGCANNGCGCTRSVDFCETVTLHESFDADGICSSSARMAYDTSFLGYTVEEMTMDAQLPCGGYCPVDVYRISLTGAIPYIVNVGTVNSGCGGDVCLAIQGSTMVDEVVGYACGGTEPDLTELSCGNVTPEISVSTERCGCSGKTNVTVRGRFIFSDLPSLMND